MPEAGKVFPVHNNKFKFGIKGLDSTDEDMRIPMNLTNFAPTIDAGRMVRHRRRRLGKERSSCKETQLLIPGEEDGR